MKTPLRIQSVDVIPVRVPRRRAYDLSRGRTAPFSPFTIVRITANEGVVGYGEGPSLVRSIHKVLTDHLVDVLPGEDVFNLTAIHAKMDAIEMRVVERLSHWNAARCAIDMALHDTQGKWLGLPLYQLLGGKQRDSFETVKSVGLDNPQTSASNAARIVGEGFTIIKIRVGTDLAFDLARLKAIREAIGPDIRIRIDANQAWDPKSAIRAIRSMQVYSLEAVEQPCKYWDICGAAEVMAHVDVPVIADEGIWTLDDAQKLLSARAADVLHVYLSKCGGIHPSMKIAALAQGFGATVTPGERVPLGISEAAHCHFAVALKTLPFPCDLADDLNEHDLLVQPIKKEKGLLYVPEGPGLGIEVDEDKLAFYTHP